MEVVTQEANIVARCSASSPTGKWIGRTIYTEYDLLIQDTLKGSARSRLTVALAGGTIGNVELAVPGRPILADGDEIVFFGEAFQGQSSFKPVGTFDGIVPGTRGRDIGITAAPRGKPEDLDAFLDEVRGLGEKPWSQPRRP